MILKSHYVFRAGTTFTTRPGTSMSESVFKAWLAAFNDCPALVAYLVKSGACDNGPFACTRSPNNYEVDNVCREFTNLSSKCRTHEVVKRWIGQGCGGSGKPVSLRFWSALVLESLFRDEDENYDVSVRKTGDLYIK